MQVSPAELEAYLILHPAIAEAAVVPSPDHAAGEVPRAFIVRSQSSMGVDENTLKFDISEFIRPKLADYKQLRGGIEFVNSLPKSVSGKILRKPLKEKAKI